MEGVGRGVHRGKGMAYGALVTVQLLFATLPVAGKLGLEGLHPTVFVAIRVALGTGCLFALERLVHASPIPSSGDLARLALFAVFGVVLNQGLFMWGLDFTTAVNATLFMTVIPVFTYAIAVGFGYEVLGAKRLGGIVLALVGVLVLLDPRRFTMGDVGNLLILANTFSYALYLVISRPILSRVPPLTAISWIFLFGGLMLVPIAWVQAGAGAFVVDARSAWILAYVVLGPTATVYALNLWALKRVASSTVAAFIYLQPIAGVFFAWWILGEAVVGRTFVAAALVFCGVALVTLGREPAVAAEVEEGGEAQGASV